MPPGIADLSRLKTDVTIDVEPGGNYRNLRIVRYSGNHIYDQAALRAVERAAEAFPAQTARYDKGKLAFARFPVLRRGFLPLMREKIQTGSYRREGSYASSGDFSHHHDFLLAASRGRSSASSSTSTPRPPERYDWLIPEFRPQDTGRDPLGLKMAQVIESDLRRSGLFFVPNRKGYLENPLRAGIRRDEQRFSDWSKVVKVEYLIKGGYTISGKTITAEVYLYDTLRSAQEIGKRYRYPKSGWRLLAHRFANAVVERFTGEKGVFDTQIAFVSRRSLKDRGKIYIMDWDGAELRRVTRNGMGNNTPAWSPDGRWMAYSSFKSRPPGVFLLPTNGAREFKVSSSSRAGHRGRFFSEFALLRVLPNSWGETTRFSATTCAPA